MNLLRLLNPANWGEPRPPKALPPAIDPGLPVGNIRLPMGAPIQQDLTMGCVGPAMRGLLDSAALCLSLRPAHSPTWEDIWRGGKVSKRNVGADLARAGYWLMEHDIGRHMVVRRPIDAANATRYTPAALALGKLYSHGAVGIVSNWCQGQEVPWEVEGGNGRTIHLADLGGRTHGLHAWIIYGRYWDERWGWLVLCRNSRGARWGDNGSFVMREAEFGVMFTRAETLAFTLTPDPAWLAKCYPND